MAKEQLELFPTEVGYELQQQEAGSINIPEVQTIEDAEWCFQFFNNEPVVFGWQGENTPPSPLVLQLQPKEGDVLTFRQNGMEFKIFSRPITEETKQQRNDESKNKEA